MSVICTFRKAVVRSPDVVHVVVVRPARLNCPQIVVHAAAVLLAREAVTLRRIEAPRLHLLPRQTALPEGADVVSADVDGGAE